MFMDQSSKPDKNIVTDPEQFSSEERRAHIKSRLELEDQGSQTFRDKLVERLGELPVHQSQETDSDSASSDAE